MVAMKKHIKQGKIADPEYDATGFPTEIGKQQHLRYIQLTSPSIFICGHNSRDIRCGILGPLLRQAFLDCINREAQRPGLQGMLGPRKVITEGEISYLRMKSPLLGTEISLISHIGGHAFAGNVVIYFPKNWKLRDSGKRSPLAGKGIWYGRVEPKHVWGIVEETIQNGRVIEELLRGVHSAKKGPRDVEKTSDESTGDKKESNEET